MSVALDISLLVDQPTNERTPVALSSNKPQHWLNWGWDIGKQGRTCLDPSISIFLIIPTFSCGLKGKVGHTVRRLVMS